MNNIAIINKVIELFGDEYKVINTYNNSEQINLNGVIAITITNQQILNNGNSKDNKTTLVISGQTFIDQDITQQKINNMYDYSMNLLNTKWFTDNLDNVAGAIINNGTITSDGQTNNFSLVVQLFICVD